MAHATKSNRPPRHAPRREAFELLLRRVAHVTDGGLAAAVGPLPRVGTVIAARYRIDRMLGRGGMGAVFAATHLVTGRRFALKWMLRAGARDANAAGRFLREARAVGRIRHPNVVDVFDVGYDGITPFLVLELIEGVSLAERLCSRPPSLEQALSTFESILRGVAAAHRCGVIHRDLKPENIVLKRCPEAREVPVIVDFGISKLVGRGATAGRTITQSGTVLGTPAFMAPEQLRGGPVDARADVYSLGVLLYAMLEREQPQRGCSYHDLLAQLASEDFAGLAELRPDVPERVVSAVGRAMSRRPDDRFPDVESFARALQPAPSGKARRARRTRNAATDARWG